MPGDQTLWLFGLLGCLAVRCLAVWLFDVWLFGCLMLGCMAIDAWLLMIGYVERFGFDYYYYSEGFANTGGPLGC